MFEKSMKIKSKKIKIMCEVQKKIKKKSYGVQFYAEKWDVHRNEQKTKRKDTY